jgi:predicted phage tail component-like protein
MLYVPGCAGGYLNDKTIEPRIIEVPVMLKALNLADLQKVKEDLAAWLITENPEELIFDDEPDRVYYAVVERSLDIEEFVNIGRGTITFICPDPYKYGPEKPVTFANTGVIPVNGTAETDPIIKVNITKDTTFVAVSNGDKLNMIGMPTKADQTPIAPETQVYNTTCNNLTGWTSPTTTDDSVMAGTLKTNGADFYSDSYGSGTVWRGPAMKTSFGTTVKDFRFDVGFSMATTAGNQAGGIILSLLDAQNKPVAKLMMTKHFGGTNAYYAKFRAGSQAIGYDIINETGKAVINKSAVSCIFRLWRKGNIWTAQIFEKVKGIYQTPYTVNWTDSNGIATADVAQIQVQLLARAAFPVVDQRIADIVFYRENNVNADQVPIVARVGDVIEFDHKSDIIRRNGEDVSDTKSFIGEYFRLSPGLNTIVAEPADSISNVEVRWRDKWL